MFRYLAVVVLAVAAASAYEVERCEGRDVKWTGGNSIAWPSQMAKSIYTNTGIYVGKNILATRTAIYRDEAIVTLPRFKHGVPITLGKVNLKSKACDTKLSPFPCWSVQEEGNCEALQSAVDLFLDSNDILWVLDTGIVDSAEQPIRRCPPKVVAFNVRTEKLVKSIDLSPLVTPTSRLQYVVADYSHDGRAFIYVSDAANRAILVYDVTSGHGYRVVLPRTVLAGCARKDVLYIALIRRADGSSCLIFTYLSGKNLFSIRTEYLQSGHTHGRVEDLGRKPQNLVLLGTDNGSALFFRNEGEAGIYRIDMTNCLAVSNAIMVYQGKDCDLPTHVAADYKRGRMRLLESNFPDFFQGTVGCGASQALNLI
ncbi:protein yellow [Nasonia vitripennis]|uniref:Bee-milk protein n=1 Tax=Nasonia vitripennis TaxID=7425 RepID=A0A7M7G540_NASVI|nr:protein yellow [Nasonia vitripennis]